MTAPDSPRELSRLSERERDVLRLLARGHDAKSVAGELGLSVHAVNERLRAARRKLGVSSSRAAARLLAAHEGDPNFSGDKEIGVGAPRAPVAYGRRPDRRAFAIGGAIMITLLVSAIAVGALGDREDPAPPRPGTPPRVVATSPAAGAVIPPGPFTLSVTFDRPMLDGNYSFVQTSAETYPQCEPRPILSRDARTFTLRCTALAGRRYEIWFNRPPYMNFKSIDGVPAQPFQLRFRTRPR